jgi:hypothetical protein
MKKKKLSPQQKEHAALMANMEHQWNNPPAPFNPAYDPDHEKWWPAFCAQRRQALIEKYLELYPNGVVDGIHFSACRNELLRKYVDPRDEEFKQAAKKGTAR